MLRKIKDLRGFELFATDGDIGSITEFYFDDLDWTILYMVVDSGAWLPGRRILVSPASLGEIDWVGRKMQAMVTRADIESSPEIDLHQPITREQEVRYFAHFGWTGRSGNNCCSRSIFPKTKPDVEKAQRNGHLLSD